MFRARHDDRSDPALHDCDETGVMRLIRAAASELLAQELGVIWLDREYVRCGLPPPVTAPFDERMVRDIEVSLNVRLRRRAAIDLLVVKDERQVLPLTICKASIAHAVRGY